KWSNADLDASPPAQRKWSAWYFFAFQFSIPLSPLTYNLGASLVAIGLNWWTILIAAFVGTILCSLLLLLNSRGSSIYHVGFPVYLRISAGFYGSLFFVVIRAAVAILYMGIQSYYASCLLAVALRCVFGHQWTDIENKLPESASITSQGLLAFFVYWALQLPFAWIHPSRAGPLFAVKAWIVPPCYIATMIWALYKASGFHFAGLHTANVSGTALGWSFMQAINLVVSGTVPSLVNIPDVARYANRPRDTWPLTAGLFISQPLVILIGLVTTSAGFQHFGHAKQTYWNIWDFNSAILDHYWNPTTRTLIFLSSFAQVYATLATNVATNSIAAGSALAGLFPLYFTLRRGQILVSILAFLIVPWNLINTTTSSFAPNSFLALFSATATCLLTPIAACMTADYYLSRRANVHVPSLYRCDPSSPYYYVRGFNLRFYAAWTVGVVLSLPGLAGSIHPSISPSSSSSSSSASTHLFSLTFILSATSSALTYTLLATISPPRIYPPGRADESARREHMRNFEGFFADEVMPEYLRDQ
ncbi:hypothetical protein K490DRAFT_9817, partial [Saccharata proteae CBS 121410]